MAAAAERPPLIGPWPGAWQVRRRRRPGAREWAPQGLRGCGEAEPGSIGGRRGGAGPLPGSPPAQSGPAPLTRVTRFGQMHSWPRKDRSHRRRGAGPPPPHHPEKVPSWRPQGADSAAGVAVPRSRPISRVLPTRHRGPRWPREHRPSPASSPSGPRAAAGRPRPKRRETITIRADLPYFRLSQALTLRFVSGGYSRRCPCPPLPICDTPATT